MIDRLCHCGTLDEALKIALKNAIATRGSDCPIWHAQVLYMQACITAMLGGLEAEDLTTIERTVVIYLLSQSERLVKLVKEADDASQNS